MDSPIPPILTICKANLVARTSIDFKTCGNLRHPRLNRSHAFSGRRTSAEAFADGGFDPGNGESADRFLSRKSDATSAASDRCRSAGRILWNDACPHTGRTRPKNCHVLSAERGERNANAHGADHFEPSANWCAVGRDGRPLDHRDADCGSFSRGDETSRAEECESARD